MQDHSWVYTTGETLGRYGSLSNRWPQAILYYSWLHRCYPSILHKRTALASSFTDIVCFYECSSISLWTIIYIIILSLRIIMILLKSITRGHFYDFPSPSSSTYITKIIIYLLCILEQPQALPQLWQPWDAQPYLTLSHFSNCMSDWEREWAVTCGALE